MTRLPSRSSLAASLAALLALSAAPARADEPPAPPPPVAPPPDLPQAPVAPAQPPAQPPPVAPAQPPLQPPPVIPGQPQYPQQQYPAQPPYPPQYAPYPPQYAPYPPQYPPPYMWPPQQPQQANVRAPDREHVPQDNWYGWQTLIAVAPFDIAMFIGLSQQGTSAATGATAVGLAGRSLTPAVVHWAHGSVGKGFGSIGLHMASMGTGVAIGYGIGLALVGTCKPVALCRNNFREVPPGPGYGAVVGSMVGTVLDVIFLAHRKKRSWTASNPGPSLAVTPVLTRDTAGAAAGGVF